MSEFTLTEDQEQALYGFTMFLSSPDPFFRITGYAGTGKTTLITHINQTIESIIATETALNPRFVCREVVYLATTNKAAQAFEEIINEPVETLHSYLCIQPDKNYRTGKTDGYKHNRSRPRREQAGDYYQKLFFVDEASMIDWALFNEFLETIEDCKVVFIGDPAQLTPVQSTGTPVYEQDWPEALLERVVRQEAGNPIIDFATAFRCTVNGGPWLENFTPDQQSIVYLSRDDFDYEVEKEFCSLDWSPSESRLLGFTNSLVNYYNSEISRVVYGTDVFQKGQYYILNKAVIFPKARFKTDAIVKVTGVAQTSRYGLAGWHIDINDRTTLFMPSNYEAKKQLIKEKRLAKQWDVVQEIEDQWADLRPIYASTVHKSQGSTFDRVFLDLDDLRKCTSPRTLARLMYVAVSRARSQIIMTGDLVAEERKSA